MLSQPTWNSYEVIFNSQEHTRSAEYMMITGTKDTWQPENFIIYTTFFISTEKGGKKLFDPKKMKFVIVSLSCPNAHPFATL